MSDGSRQKNKRGDSKVESNDSPEIRDRGETSDIPGLPWGENDIGVRFALSKNDLVQLETNGEQLRLLRH